MGGENESADWDVEALESELQSMLQDGVLTDLVEVDARNLKNPRSIAPFSHLPLKLYESPTVTRILTACLDNINPGTEATYNQILSAIQQQTHTDSFCYVHGGQVRDILMGKISKDVDINYACTAKDVALVCVQNEWPIKYIAIGTEGKPNYVMIGIEQSGLYMEGFSLSYNISEPRIRQDFRRNMLAYDFTNQVIIDKTGYGVQDIRNNELRFACAPSKDMWEDWARNEATTGEKALRFVKFVMRGILRHKPLKVDAEESAFAAILLKKALRENAESLKGFWFRYLLGECLSKQEGVNALYKWVCNHDRASWWEEWLPFVKPVVADVSWLETLTPVNGQADIVKEHLARFDDVGDGLIDADYLKQVFRELNIDLTDAEFNMLCDKSSTTSGKLNVDEFVDFVLAG